MSPPPAWRRRWRSLQLAPDGRPRPDAPPFRGPLAARALGKVIDAAAWGGSRLPASTTHAVATVGGMAEWSARPAKRARLAKNLAHAVGLAPSDPAVRRLVRQEMANEAKRSADLLWALGRRDELLATTVVNGLEHILDSVARGNGMILSGIHLGGWEIATAIPAAHIPVPTTAVVADNWLAWAIDHFRDAAGLRTMFRSDSALGAARILRRGEVFLVLGDDGWGEEPRCHSVRFLDARAQLPAGIVSLARLCGSPIVNFVCLPHGRRRWVIDLDPPVEPPGRRDGEAGEIRVLQQLADRWSELIRAHPEHWAAAYHIRWEES